jgi:hypothetical protein
MTSIRMVKLPYRKYFIWEGFLTTQLALLIGVLFERRICKPYPLTRKSSISTEHSLPCPPAKRANPISATPSEKAKQSLGLPLIEYDLWLRRVKKNVDI